MEGRGGVDGGEGGGGVKGHFGGEAGLGAGDVPAEGDYEGGVIQDGAILVDAGDLFQ